VIVKNDCAKIPNTQLGECNAEPNLAFLKLVLHQASFLSRHSIPFCKFIGEIYFRLNGKRRSKIEIPIEISLKTSDKNYGLWDE